MNKNLLIIAIALLSVNLDANAQSLGVGGMGSTSYFICNSNNPPQAWGSNSGGQLGVGTTENVLSPEEMPGFTGVTAIARGEFQSLFLKDDGTVFASGNNFYGQLGDGTNTYSSSPVQVSGLSDIIGIATGQLYSLFLKSDGTVWACGRNDKGQLGDGTTTESNIPVQVIGLSDITAISAGHSHSLFLKNDGTVWACGSNSGGQLGNDTTSETETSIAVQMSETSNVIAVSGGSGHTLLLKNDGTVWSCGSNYYGQLGIGWSSGSHIPVQITDLSGITAISAGLSHSQFLKNDGTVWATGGNDYGKLGNGYTGDKNSPVQVSISGVVVAISSGYYHTQFLKNDGTLWACGWNYMGQIGDGTTIERHTPIQVYASSGCGTVSVDEINAPSSNLTAYPNPANTHISIKVESDKLIGKQIAVKIFNATGKEVFESSRTGNWVDSQSTIDISSLSPGMYLIRLFDGENQSQGKFVKE